jgi:hypothetical protein
MKRILKITLLAIMLVLAGSLRNSVSAQYDQGYPGDNDVSYQTFYDQLSPYGQWIDYPGYGYVWVPDAGDDFRPYSTNGHWVWTEDYEWMWVSDYDWGWAPFHYGRWEEDPNYGWFWVPGYEWSSAWVAWRDGGDYYGWAPLRPGINISLNFNIGSYNPPSDYWCFVPRRYISSPRVYDYYVDRSININIISRTTIININRYNSSYGWRTGPSRYEAERYCGRINPVQFRQANAPGRSFYRNNEVSFYRPNVRREDMRSAAPRQFERYDRNNGGFRNRTGNNSNDRGDVFRNRGNSTERNDGFRRNDNTNGNMMNGNGRPERRERTDNDQTFRRDDNNTRQPQVYNNDQRGRPDRTAPGVQPDEQRRFRSPDPRTNNGSTPVDNNRGFDRRTDNGGYQRPVPEQPRQFERRNMDINRGNDQIRRNDNGGGQRTIETRPAPQQQERQFERRTDNNNTRQPQVYQQRQEQPRSVDKRDDGNRGGGNGNEGRGRGRGRF